MTNTQRTAARFIDLTPGDVVESYYGGTMLVLDVKPGQPGNIPDVPRTVVRWVEYLPTDGRPHTYRGAWTAARTEDTQRPELYVIAHVDITKVPAQRDV